MLQATVDVMTAEQYADDDIKKKSDSILHLPDVSAVSTGGKGANQDV